MEVDFTRGRKFLQDKYHAWFSFWLLAPLAQCLAQSRHSLYMGVEVKQVKVAFRYCISLTLSNSLTSNLLLHTFSSHAYTQFLLHQLSIRVSEERTTPMYNFCQTIWSSSLQRSQLVKIVMQVIFSVRQKNAFWCPVSLALKSFHGVPNCLILSCDTWLKSGVCNPGSIASQLWQLPSGLAFHSSCIRID